MGSRKAHCLEPSHQRARAPKTETARPLAPQWQVRGRVWTTSSTSSPVMDHGEISSCVQTWVEDICKNHRGWNLHSVIMINSSFMIYTSKEFIFGCDPTACVSVLDRWGLTHDSLPTARSQWIWFHNQQCSSKNMSSYHQRQIQQLPTGPIHNNSVTFCFPGCDYTKPFESYVGGAKKICSRLQYSVIYYCLPKSDCKKKNYI